MKQRKQYGCCSDATVNPPTQSRRHGGFGGLSPPNTAPIPPKLKYETL